MYEKFLITSGVTAPQFEANIAEQEKRRQFLSSLSGGIVIPETLVKNEFKKENQTKIIKYIDLEKYHSSKKPTEESKRDLYERNKEIFFKELSFTVIFNFLISRDITFFPIYSDKIFSIRFVFGKFLICSLLRLSLCRYLTNSCVLIFSESIEAITFWLPPLNTSPIPQKTNGRIIIPTKSLIKNDLENFPIEVNIIIIY